MIATGINPYSIQMIRKYDSKIILTESPTNYRRRNVLPETIKINKDEYLDKRSNQVKKYKHNTKRTAKSFNRSFKTLEDKINANFSGEENELFATLTFDNSSTPEDYKFNQDVVHNKQVAKNCQARLTSLFRKLATKFNKNGNTIIHIVIMEPQRTGVPHYHLLLKLLNSTNIPLNEIDLEELWSQGEVHVEALEDTTRLPAYFHAHLTDIPFEEADNYEKSHHKTVFKKINNQQKKFVKGARLAYFPKDINYFSSSKGLKIGIKAKITGKQANEIIKDNKMRRIDKYQYEAKQYGSENEQKQIVTRQTWESQASLSLSIA